MIKFIFITVVVAIICGFLLNFLIELIFKNKDENVGMIYDNKNNKLLQKGTD